MARPVNALKIIEENKHKINDQYDLRLHDIINIKNNYKGVCEVISNAFVFGYAQGVKAQKKGRAFNG